MPDERSGPNLALAPALTLELEREHESCGSPPPHGALRAYCVPTRRGRGAIEYCRVGRVLAHARARACVRARVRACVRTCCCTSQAGVIEYCWDMLFVSIFVQLGTGFVSDWLWLVYTVPPAIGLYYLWVKIIYPWISKPDEEPQAPEPKMKMKKGR